MSEMIEAFTKTLDAMSGLEQTSFMIFLAMTITFFAWILYLVVSK